MAASLARVVGPIASALVLLGCEIVPHGAATADQARRDFSSSAFCPMGRVEAVRVEPIPPPPAAIAPDVQLSPAGDYLMWAVSAQHDQFPVSDAGLVALDPGGLHEVAATMISKWHPELRELVAHADGGETFLVRISTSVPVPPWQPSRVTVLGDAIHAMSPARGSGANTALQDAALLSSLLSQAGSDPAAAVAAIGRYEQQMRDYGFAAVAASRQAEQLTAARSGGLLVRLASRLPQVSAPDDPSRPPGDSQS